MTMTITEIHARLEYLRGRLRSESISWGEMAELQGLAEHIEPGDVELLEAAGVPEFPDEEAQEIDWENICDVADVTNPRPFPDHDQDGNPGQGEWLSHIPHGEAVIDRDGNRFVLLGWGSVQGSVILVDADGRQFHADSGMRLLISDHEHCIAVGKCWQDRESCPAFEARA